MRRAKEKKDFVKEAKYINVATGGLFILTGLFLVIFVTTFQELTPLVKWFIGGCCILIGAAKILGYFSNDLYRLAFQFDLALGVLAAVLGGFVFATPDGIFNRMHLFVGFFAVAEGLLKMQMALDARRFGMRRWGIILASATVLSLVGIAAIAVPDNLGLVLSGAALIAEGLESIWVTMYTVRVRARKKQYPLEEENEKDYS